MGQPTPSPSASNVQAQGRFWQAEFQCQAIDLCFRNHDVDDFVCPQSFDHLAGDTLLSTTQWNGDRTLGQLDVHAGNHFQALDVDTPQQHRKLVIVDTGRDRTFQQS